MGLANLSNWCPLAKLERIPGWRMGGGNFTDTAHPKVVWHTTQGYDAGLRNTYRASGGIPHFTIWTDGRISQHYSTAMASRALKNKAGYVQTNRDGVIQIEIVGFSGNDVSSEQLIAIQALTDWLTQGGISPTYPMGRLSKPYRRATGDEWDNGIGHFAHGMVPENNHTDPDMTDATWEAFLTGLDTGQRAYTPQAFDPPHNLALVVGSVTRDPKYGPGFWLATIDGGVANYEGAPFYGAAAGKDYWLDNPDRRADTIKLRDDGLDGYTLVSEDGENYDYTI